MNKQFLKELVLELVKDFNFWTSLLMLSFLVIIIIGAFQGWVTAY